MPLQCGDTFLFQTNPAIPENLYIVLAHLDPAQPFGVCVNLTTLRPKADTTCVLTPGDHPFVNRPSIVLYRRTAELDLIQIAQQFAAIQTMICVPKSPCSPPLLFRIQQGFLASRFTPQDLKERCRAHWTAAGIITGGTAG